MSVTSVAFRRPSIVAIMSEKAIEKNIAHLVKLLKNPDRQEGSVQHTIRELLQLSHEGRELSPETVKWLKETASPFLSPELLDVLTKLCLKIGLSA